jgi:hypothetical protein
MKQRFKDIVEHLKQIEGFEENLIQTEFDEQMIAFWFDTKLSVYELQDMLDDLQEKIDVPSSIIDGNHLKGLILTIF